MNNLTAFFIIVFLCVFLIGVIVVLAKIISKQKKEIRDLKALEKYLQKTISVMTEYIKKNSEIKNDELKVMEKIADATNEEDLLNVVSCLINSNNDRVRNDKNKN